MAHVHGHHAADEPPATSLEIRRILAAAVALFALAAVVGLVVLWPSGERPELTEELGLGNELVDATINDVGQVPCAGTTAADGIFCQEIRFEVTSGSPSGEAGSFEIPADAFVSLDVGDDVVLGFQPDNEGQLRYYFNDYQRDTPLQLLVLIFVVAVVALARWRGVRALVGLVVTGTVMVAFLFPSILDGNDPATVALVAAVVIGLVALYLTHGVNERTTVALLGAFCALALTAVLAAIFTSAARFTGFSSEDAYFLQVAAAQIDIQGLVLAGIIVGSLGVLDDVTITQVSAVWQLHEANPGYGVRRLYRAGVEIGRDHIASTVNTLVLAYAGASLPLLLLFTQAGRRLTDVAVGELVAVEVVRTLVGSIGLVAAVPVTTALAAWVVTRGPGDRAAGRVSRWAATAVARRVGAAAPSAGRHPGAHHEEPQGAAPIDEQAAWDRFGPDDSASWGSRDSTRPD